MFFHSIHYVVVIVAAVIGMAVSFVWHSPWAFGKLWLKSKGWAVMTISTLVSAFIIAALLNSLVVTSIGGMALVALCVWIGFIVPTKLGDYLFGRDTFTSFLIAIGHGLVVTLVMTLVIGIWG